MDNVSESMRLLRELESLLLVRKKLVDTEEINGLIADVTEIFLNTIFKDIDKEVDKKLAEKKSELPCNCQKENIQEKIIKAVVDSVKKNSPPDTKVTIFTVD